MSSQIVRRVSIVAAAALLLAVVAMTFAGFNARPVQAGGSPQPLYKLFSDKITANATFTIYTTTSVNGISKYTVYSQPSNSDYYVAVLGTDYLCIQSAKDAANHPLCLPYSAIAGITY